MDEQREVIRSAIRGWIHTQEDSRTATPLQFLMNREDLLADAILAFQSTHASAGMGERAAIIEECARVAEGAGRPVGMGDGDTYTVGTSLDAARAIRALNPDAPSGESGAS